MEVNDILQSTQPGHTLCHSSYQAGDEVFEKISVVLLRKQEYGVDGWTFEEDLEHHLAECSDSVIGNELRAGEETSGQSLEA